MTFALLFLGALTLFGATWLITGAVLDHHCWARAERKRARGLHVMAPEQRSFPVPNEKKSPRSSSLPGS